MHLIKSWCACFVWCRNPEIQAIVPILLSALQDPAKKTSVCLQTLLQTQFVHFIGGLTLIPLLPSVATGTSYLANKLTWSLVFCQIFPGPASETFGSRDLPWTTDYFMTSLNFLDFWGQKVPGLWFPEICVPFSWWMSNLSQCSGSFSQRCGSAEPDPHLWLTDPALALFVSDLQDVNKSFLPITFWRNIYIILHR